jgi:hypothetical protein
MTMLTIALKYLRGCVCGGWLPQADDPTIAALSRPQGLSRHRRDVDFGDAAQDDASAPGASVGRAGDGLPDYRALARMVGFRPLPIARRGSCHGRSGAPVDIAGLPISLLDRFAGGIEQQLTACCGSWERWFYRAPNERQDPGRVLRRKRRQDASEQGSMTAPLRQALLAPDRIKTVTADRRTRVVAADG